MKMIFKVFGDSNSVSKQIMNLKQELPLILDKAVKETADDYKKKLVSYIRCSGQKMFHPISYRKGKVLIRSGVYINSITNMKKSTANYLVSFPEGSVEPDSGFPLDVLGEVLEYGLGRMKAPRPHWSVVLNRFNVGKLKRKVNKMIRQTIK